MANFFWNGDGTQGCPGKGVFWNGDRASEVFWNGVKVLEESWEPTSPLSFNATDSECEQITFTWSNPTDMGNPLAQFDLYQGGNLIAADINSGHVETIRQQSSIPYSVKAQNVCGDNDSNVNNGNSNWQSDAVQDFNASDGNCESITFTWSNPSEDGFPDATYDIYKGTTLIQANATSPETVLLKEASPVAFHVKSVNHCAEVNSNSDFGSSTWKPSAPLSPGASDCNSTAITVTWSASSDVGYPACTYDVLRNGTTIATNVASGYVDNTAAANTTYTYTVRATNACGSTTSSGTSGRRGVAPGAPTSFAASVNNTGALGHIICTWTNPSNDGYPNATYNVYANSSLVASNVTSPYYYPTSYDGNITLYVQATNSCGSSNSNTDVGNAYQKDPPKTVTYYSSGTHVLGTGHTIADVCVVGGGGGGAWRPSDDNHRGGGHAGGANSQAAINNSSNIAVSIGGGGPGLSTLGGYAGYATTVLGIVGSGGGAGISNALSYYGTGNASGSVCGFGAARDGYSSTLSGNRSAGGQGSVGNGGSGESVGGSINGGTGAGGGASYGGVGTSGSGGSGVAVVTTY